MTIQHSQKNEAGAGPRDSYARRLQKALTEAHQRRVVACESTDDSRVTMGVEPAPADPELAYVTRAWPRLPRAVRDALLAVVRGCDEGVER